MQSQTIPLVRSTAQWTTYKIKAIRDLLDKTARQHFRPRLAEDELKS